MKLGKYLLLIAFVIISFSSCEKNDEVVVYTAVDQVVSEKIFKDFERETGIRVKAVYDIEANKTTGLVNRIIAEKKHPVCDVFWNNEFIQTMKLKDEGLLEAYQSSSASDIGEKYKDEDGYWTAFGGRARVILINVACIEMDREDFPRSFFDLLDKKYDGEMIAMPYPLFGTTRTHVAAMYALFGRDEARSLYQDIYERGVQIVDGNSVSKDMVVRGNAYFGYTDSDDAKLELDKLFSEVYMVYPDQGEDEMGTLITPSTVAMIKGGQNKKNAEIFIDYLLKKETELRLVDDGFFDLSIREEGSKIKGMDVSLYEIYENMDVSAKDMQEIFGVR